MSLKDYPATRSAQKIDDFQEKTASRLKKVQAHLTNAPRGNKLKDKVCIITGVGSLKGIGFVAILLLHARIC